MFGEKRGGAGSWTPSTLALQSLQQPLESSASIAGGQILAQRQACTAGRHSTSTDNQQTTDSSLTSLGWLPNLKVLDMFSPEVHGKFHPPSPCSEDGGSWETVSSSSASPGGKNDPFLSSVEPCPLSPLHQCLVHSAQFKLAPKRYRSDSTKPPYSHTSLVYLAIQHSRSGKSSFHDICRWIKTNFKFFKEAEPGWQNSIRQNLAMSELFVKVARSNGEPSKGCCWTIHPRYREFLDREDRKPGDGGGGRKLKRAYSYGGSNGRQSRGGARKRMKSEAQLPVDPCGLPGDLDWISLLSSQRVSCGSYGSPILGPPDLGQVGDPMICSPLIVPASIASSPSTTHAPSSTEHTKSRELEEDVFHNHSSPLPPPSPGLLPWSDSRPQSPSPLHPWAESKETTLKSLGHQQSITLPHSHAHSHTHNNIWSPETSYSSSLCSTSSSLLSRQHKLRTADSYIY